MASNSKSLEEVVTVESGIGMREAATDASWSCILGFLIIEVPSRE